MTPAVSNPGRLSILNLSSVFSKVFSHLTSKLTLPQTLLMYEYEEPEEFIWQEVCSLESRIRFARFLWVIYHI